MVVTILVVDDEEVIRELLTEVLVDEGYRVRCAADGIEALDIIAREQPDLVLSDVCMPRLDGCALADRLARSGNRVPIVLMSAGCDGAPLPNVRFVPKPFDIDRVLAAIEAALAPAEPALSCR